MRTESLLCIIYLLLHLIQVLSHLNAENDYCAQATKHFSGLQDSLYSEILSHLKETDEDVPYKHGAFEYYTRTVQGLSYKIHCRKPVTGGPEEVILDENEVAKGHEYCDVSGIVPSPGHDLLAYAVDNSGYETYQIYVKNLRTGEILSDAIEGSDGNIVWDRDSSRLYYLTMDDEHRPDQLHLHVLGTAQSEDVCLYTEEDSR